MSFNRMAGTFDAGQEYNDNISSHRIPDRNPIAVIIGHDARLSHPKIQFRTRSRNNLIQIKTLTRTLLTEKNNVPTIPTILVCDIRSLFPKIDELGCVINLNSADVICVIETWLSGKISDS